MCCQEFSLHETFVWDFSIRALGQKSPPLRGAEVLAEAVLAASGNPRRVVCAPVVLLLHNGKHIRSRKDSIIELVLNLKEDS